MTIDVKISTDTCQKCGGDMKVIRRAIGSDQFKHLMFCSTCRFWYEISIPEDE